MYHTCYILYPYVLHLVSIQRHHACCIYIYCIYYLFGYVLVPVMVGTAFTKHMIPVKSITFPADNLEYPVENP